MDKEEEHMTDRGAVEQRPFLKSRFGIGLILFLAIAGFLLLFEHRAHIPGDYYLLGGFLAFCIGIHLFMHGGHGGHAHGRQHDHREGR